MEGPMKDPQISQDGKKLLRANEPKKKRAFTEAQLTFVEPKLVKQGHLTEVTGFFGTFSP